MKNPSIVTIVDLAQIARELGGQFDPDDDFRVKCDCGAELTQSMNRCEACDKPVIWRNSPKWEDKFGSAKLAEAPYRVVKPTTESGRVLCELSGAGFSSKQEEQAWANVDRRLGSVEAMKIVTWVLQRSTGRAAISFAINVGRKKSPKPVKKDTPDTMGGAIW